MEINPIQPGDATKKMQAYFEHKADNADPHEVLEAILYSNGFGQMLAYLDTQGCAVMVAREGVAE